MNFKDIKVLFGNFDTDLIFEYTMVMNWLPDDKHAEDPGSKATKGNKETIFYDEFKMVTTATLEVVDDIGYLNILNHKLDLNNKFAQTTSPEKNTIDVTENEYREFLQSLGFTLNEMKKWLNDVILLDGIKFPYKLDEIKSEIKFQQGSMHWFMELEDNLANYLEDEFWDEKYKEKQGKSDVDAEAREIEFWDWKDMADDDFVAAEEAVEKMNDKKDCKKIKGDKACKHENDENAKKKKASEFID